jgi:filamentous hemagglutinin
MEAGKQAEAVTAGVSVSVSVSVIKSSQDSAQSAVTHRGTNIQAKTIDITARDSDITAPGVKLQAHDVTLDAARGINLQAAKNTIDVQSSNKGSSAGFGATLSFGGEQNGLSFQASASQSKGNANGSELTHATRKSALPAP